MRTVSAAGVQRHAARFVNITSKLITRQDLIQNLRLNTLLRAVRPAERMQLARPAV